MSDSVTKYYEYVDRYFVQDDTMPKKNTDPIVEIVVQKMKNRSKVGIEKYNTTLHDSPDGYYTFLNHLQEELMDAILYIEKLKSFTNANTKTKQQRE